MAFFSHFFIFFSIFDLRVKEILDNLCARNSHSKKTEEGEEEEAEKELEIRLEEAEMKSKHLEEDNRDLRARLDEFKGFVEGEEFILK